MNPELPEVQAGFRKGREIRDQIATSVGSWKKQESSRKTSTSSVLTTPKPLTVWITTNCGKLLKRCELPDQLTCFLRNLYAGQEATVRTRHGTIDWFKIGKNWERSMSSCILSPCIFNLCAEYIMQNVKLD